jgi:hypothetical protein
MSLDHLKSAVYTSRTSSLALLPLEGWSQADGPGFLTLLMPQDTRTNIILTGVLAKGFIFAVLYGIFKGCSRNKR